MYRIALTARRGDVDVCEQGCCWYVVFDLRDLSTRDCLCAMKASSARRGDSMLVSRNFASTLLGNWDAISLEGVKLTREDMDVYDGLKKVCMVTFVDLPRMLLIIYLCFRICLHLRRVEGEG